jgi:CubicO group peptidase (beta-lactamase class C family)
MLVAALTAALLQGAAFQAPKSPNTDSLDAFIRDQMVRRHVDGLSLAIEQNGRIVYARGYGVTDRAEHRAVDTTTLFQAGSISKPVSSLAALRLVEQGRLSLDENVNRRLTSWQVPATQWTAHADVTLRRLLSHTAGLTIHGFPGYDADSARPTVVQVLDGAPPANTAPVRNDTFPGARWNYSGGGFTVAQLLMTDVTRESYPALLHRLVLQPLGMGRSSFEQPLPATLAARTAAGHYQDGSEVHARSHVYPEMAAAGLWTTASDLLRFAIGVQDAYAGRRNALVSRETAKQMLTEQLAGAGYGLGLSTSTRDSVTVFGHGGRDEGFDARLRATAQTGQGYALMINANDDSRMMGRIGDYIERMYGWTGASTYRAPAAVAAAPSTLESATGVYDVGNGGLVTLVTRDGHLFDMSAGALDEEFIPVGVDRYASAERDFHMDVRRDSSGAVVALSATEGSGTPIVASRLGPLFRGATMAVPLDSVAAARGVAVLRAMSAAGDAVKNVEGLTAVARVDFSGHAAWPPVAGFQSATLAGSSVVSGGVQRHGNPVARVGYYRVMTPAGAHRIIVYFTPDNLVTDVDVIDE